MPMQPMPNNDISPAMKGLLDSMKQSLNTMKDSLGLTASESSLQKTNLAILETNSLLSEVLSTLKDQLSFEKESAKREKFEQSKRKDDDMDGGSLEEPAGASKIGKILSGLGVGLKIVATGLMAFANPLVIAGGAVAIGLFTVLGTVLGLMAKFFGRDIAEFIGHLIREVGTAIVDVAAYIGQNKDMLQEAIDVVFYFVNSIIDSFVRFVDAMWPYIREIIQMFADFAIRVIDAVGDLIVKIMPPITELIGVFLDSFERIVELFLNFLVQIAPFVERMFSVLVDGFVRIVELLQPVMLRLLASFDNLVTKFVELIAILQPIVLEIIDVIRDFVNGVLGVIRTLIEQISPILDSFRGIIEAFGNIITGVITGIFDGLSNLFVSLGDGISTVVDSVFGGIERMIRAIGDTIINVISGVVDNIFRLQEIDEDDISGAANGIRALGGALAAFAGGSIVAAIGNLFGGNGIVRNLERLGEVADPLHKLIEALYLFQDAVAAFRDADFSSIRGFNAFARQLNTDASLVGEALDTILSGGGLSGNRAGSAAERLATLQTLTGNNVSSRVAPIGSNLENRSTELAASQRQTQTPMAPSITSASNVSSSFNNSTNQVFVTSGDDLNTTLSRLTE